MPQKQKERARTRLIAKISDKRQRSLTRKAEITEKLLLEREKSFLARGPPPLAGEGLGVGFLTRKAQKSQKSYASGSPPIGEDGRGLFPLGEDLEEALRG